MEYKFSECYLIRERFMRQFGRSQKVIRTAITNDRRILLANFAILFTQGAREGRQSIKWREIVKHTT